MKLLAALVALVVALTSCGSSSPSVGSRGTVAGRVLSGPRCPVERAGSPCPPEPVNGASVVALSADHVVASTRTDPRGRFQLRLAPGRYVIRATNVGGYASTAEKNVTVADGQSLTITLVVDTGIR